MKKYCLFLLLFVFVLSGCSSITTEEVDSLVSESYEEGKSDGYDIGYDAGYEDAQNEISVDSTITDQEKESIYSEGYQNAVDDYSGYIEYDGELIWEEDFINYYSLLCDTLGLPEYHYPYNEEEFLNSDYYKEKTESETSQEGIVYWTPNGSRYHSTENCRTLNKSKVINSGTIDEAIASGHNEPCSVCY